VHKENGNAGSKRHIIGEGSPYFEKDGYGPKKKNPKC